MKPSNHLIPQLKKIEPNFGSSIKYSRLTERKHNQKPYWHYHPEVELVYIKNGKGKRFIGNDVSSYDNGDLILLGPNIPHLGFEHGLQEDNEEYVVQFKKNLFKSSVQFIPELESIGELIAKSKSGISFYGETKKIIGEDIELMENKSPFDRLIDMFKILQHLAQSDEYEMLNTTGITLIIQNQDDERINQVYQFVKENYQSEISLNTISALATMTAPSFCRFFKKHTSKTFTQFVNEFRIRQAIRLIGLGNKSISEIALEVGYNNFSHFNKEFKKLTGQTPSKFKKIKKQIIA